MPQTGAIDGRLYVGENQTGLRKFLPKQSMQNILYVIILTLTLLVAVFVGFLSQVSAGKAGTDHRSG